MLQNFRKNPKRSKSFESLFNASKNQTQGKCTGYDDDSGPPNTPASRSISDLFQCHSHSSISDVPTVTKIKEYLVLNAAEEFEDIDAGGDTVKSIKEKYSMRKLVYQKLIDFCQCWLREKGLFPQTYCLDSDESLIAEKPQGSDEDIFVKGFKLRNIDSLQKFLAEEKKLLDKIAQQPTFSTSVSSTPEEPISEESISIIPSTHIPPKVLEHYLMPEEHVMPSYEFPFVPCEEAYSPPPTEEYWHSNSAVRKAQAYLRNHKIFQFFNYLTSMLVSAVPETEEEDDIDINQADWSSDDDDYVTTTTMSLSIIK